MFLLDLDQIKVRIPDVLSMDKSIMLKGGICNIRKLTHGECAVLYKVKTYATFLQITLWSFQHVTHLWVIL